MFDDVGKLTLGDTVAVHDNALGDVGIEESSAKGRRKEAANLGQHSRLVLDLSFVSDEVTQDRLRNGTSTANE